MPPRAAWLAVVLLLACAPGRAPAADPRAIILATTTSVQDTGLLDELLPMFSKKTGIVVKPIAVGTGEALAMAARGEADVVLVHAPEAEQRFMAAGHGARRRALAHNDFVLLGPPDDPAGVRGRRSAVEAMAAIAAAKAPFTSRGDESGTHKKEKALWKAAGVSPARPWYLESGSGQAETLQIASQRRTYALSDRGTFLFLRGKIDLVIVVEGDPLLVNKYSVIELDTRKHPGINAAGGTALADFLVSPEAQSFLARYGVDRVGQPLFIPDAVK